MKCCWALDNTCKLETCKHFIEHFECESVDRDIYCYEIKNWHHCTNDPDRKLDKLRHY